MKKMITVIVCLFGLFGLAQQKTNGLEISRLTENAFVYTTYNDFNGNRFPSNGLYVVADGGVILIDTPWDEKQFQPLLDSISKRHRKPVKLCIATHYHDDRTAGLEFFRGKGIKTYASKQTFDLCKSHNEKQPEFYFSKDTTFTLGNVKLETFYPGEGHTKDNIVIWFAGEKILYGGCFVKSTENESLGNIADANLKAWPASIKRTMHRFPKPAFVVPGHFGWQSDKSLDHTFKLLRKHQKQKKR